MYRIDAHQHYWDPAHGGGGWLAQEDAILRRAYGPADLRPELARHGVGRTVLIQAAPSEEETRRLLALAEATPSVAAVVGRVDFADRSWRKHLERLAEHPKFVGVRPVGALGGDHGWMLRDDVQWGFRALVEMDLTLDAFGVPEQLENFRRLLAKYPDMRVVIDHCMKPPIRSLAERPELFREWAGGMRRIAGESGAFCKLSGLVTEAAEGWCADDLRPVAETVLEGFGVERVMWGSDWPFCRLRASYDEWMAAALELTGGLRIAERQEIFAGTARRFYRL